LLDDIALAVQSNALAMNELPRIHANDLGPLIELRHLGLMRSSDGWLDAGRHGKLLGGLTNGGKWFHPTRGQGLVTVTAIETDYANWTDFAMRAKRAATESDFSGDEAGQFVAAMGELRSNIVEHSERCSTGYLVFDATPSRFEFVVADAGIGVLQSLRWHPHYSNVRDAGTALHLALSEGVSRFYGEKDRGRGFRPIFVGLANASKHLRFRSGDHSREIIQDGDGNLLATTHQRAHIDGFVSCVVCEARSRKRDQAGARRTKNLDRSTT
jgi:anti-sigma regulatory factor (Ser/Thr protein kinase)